DGEAPKGLGSLRFAPSGAYPGRSHGSSAGAGGGEVDRRLSAQKLPLAVLAYELVLVAPEEHQSRCAVVARRDVKPLRRGPGPVAVDLDLIVRHHVIRARAFGARIMADRSIHELEDRLRPPRRAEAADPFPTRREKRRERPVVTAIVRFAVRKDQRPNRLAVLEDLDPGGERFEIRMRRLGERTERRESCGGRPRREGSAAHQLPPLFVIVALRLVSAFNDAVTRQCFFALSRRARACASSAPASIVSAASMRNLVNFRPSRVLSTSPVQLTSRFDQASRRGAASARNVRIRQLATAPVNIVSGDQ